MLILVSLFKHFLELKKILILIAQLHKDAAGLPGPLPERVQRLPNLSLVPSQPAHLLHVASLWQPCSLVILSKPVVMSDLRLRRAT